MLAHLAVAFVAIFVALDVIGTLPMYLAMTRGLDPEQKKEVVDKSMLVAFVVAIAFLFVGRSLFGWLGITVPDFKIAGGLVLLLVSLADLLGGPESAHNRASGSTGIVPLAVPLITGPGVLTQTLLQADTRGYPVTIAALIANFVIAWALLRRSDGVDRVIGRDGTVVVSKIAALLLAAIAVAMIRGGILEVLSKN